MNALLIGALLVSSTSVFVSCKDYDDDVNSLQTQINSLSSLVSQKETTIDGSIASLQSSIDKLNGLEATLRAAILAGDNSSLSAANEALAAARAALEAADVATLASAKAGWEAADATTLATALAKIDEGDVATLAAAREAVNAAKTELETALNNRYDNLVARDAELSAAIIKAQTASDAANTLIEQVQSKLQDGIDKAQKAAEAAAAAAETAQTDAAAALAAANKAQQSIETLNSSVNDAKSEIAAINTKLNDAITKLNTLSTEVTAATSNIAELKTALAAQTAALESLKTDLVNSTVGTGDTKADVSDLKTKIATAEAAIAALQSTVATLENTLNTTIAQESQSVNTKLGELGIDLNTLKVTVSDLAAQHNNFAQASAVNTLNTTVQGLQGDITNVSKEVTKVDTKIDVMTAILAKALRSLVFQPYLYVDGIESIEYPYLVDTALAKTAPVVVTRQRTTAGYAEDYTKTIRNIDDWVVPATISEEYFGPTWPVAYHMNPSKANPKYDDVEGFNQRNAEVITRSYSGEHGYIKAAETYADGSKLYSTENGTLTVGIKVDRPERLAHHATPTETQGRPGTVNENGVDYGDREFDDIVALQVKSAEGDDETKLVTSDYAMIYPEKVWVEAIVWTKYSQKKGYSVVNYDEACPYLSASSRKLHVWETPQDALGVNDATVYPDVELYYNNQNGMKLSDYLGVHYVKDVKPLSRVVPGSMGLNSTLFKQFGLSYEFELVDYTIDGNTTHDSKYCTLDPKDGTIIAKNVKEDGTTIDTESATSVDREPLVRVKVKRGDRVIKDGYILVHITRAADPNQQLVVDNYPAQNATFDLCNGQTVFTTNWSQFSYYVLTQKLNNMTKEQFDANYGEAFDGVPDLLPSYVATTLSDNSVKYTGVKVFENTTGTVSNTRNLPGRIIYYHNSVGTTNHRFEWEISDDELEEYTHDNANLPRQITKYFRYTGKAGAAYEYIYVKLTINLDRKTIAETGIAEKNDNYWYKYTGADQGWDAVVWNPWYPMDGGNTKTYRQYLVSTFKENKANLTNTSLLATNASNTVRNARVKYFFVPQNFTITSQKGVTYTITPQRNALDEQWNAFVCKYLKWNNNGTNNNAFNQDGTNTNLHAPATYTTHKWGTEAENKAIHEKCAIDYNAGVYTNNTLYAVTNYGTATAVYTPIATLTQTATTGQMDLIWRTPDNDVTKEVLNAIGYYDDVHSNILDELHTMVGVIANNGCDVAVNINEYQKDAENTNAATFYVSWQRPINVETNATPLVDAKNNGDYIYSVDFLKMFDWRGPVSGKMYDENQWLWAYYNIKSITINTLSTAVYTNMHQSDPNTFVQLSTITNYPYFHLYTLKQDGTPQYGNLTITLPSLSAYNAADKNAALKTLMGLPSNSANKVAFAGGLFYENNGDNVTEFDIRVPVTIAYDWGEFVTNVQVHINRTLGN